MNTEKNTPGPWRVAPFYSEVHIVNGMADTVCIVQVRRSDDSPQSAVAHANAKLIAAAPDLLAACKAIVDCPDYRHTKTHEMHAARQAIAQAGP